MAIMVWVRLFADMKRYRPTAGERFSVELPDGAAVETLLAFLGAAGDEDVIVAVGGVLAEPERLLRNQDEVELIGRITGG